MKLSVEILDYIFSFLVSHRQTLIACSKDPLLSPIVERYLYNHFTFTADTCTGSYYVQVQQDDLFELISENPRIRHYIRILDIRVIISFYSKQKVINKSLDTLAKSLLMLPALECIMFTVTSHNYVCHWSDAFRAALDDRVSHSTVKELHLAGRMDPPFSFLDNCKNIKSLSLSRLLRPGDQFGVSTLPQLESLALEGSAPFLAWVKLHINDLRSLKCAASSVQALSELFGVCSRTLNKLDIDLANSYYCSNYIFETGEIVESPLPNLSPIPPRLQQLIIHATVSVGREFGLYRGQKRRESYLPAAAGIINLFTSSLRHLIVGIDIFIPNVSPDLSEIDFSPLAVLGAASLSIPCIDLYVRTETFPSDVTLAHLLSALADYEDVMRSIKEGVLIIHSEEVAPGYVEED